MDPRTAEEGSKSLADKETEDTAAASGSSANKAESAPQQAPQPSSSPTPTPAAAPAPTGGEAAAADDASSEKKAGQGANAAPVKQEGGDKVVEINEEKPSSFPPLNDIPVETLYDHDKYNLSTMDPTDVFQILQ
ncbi:hypothetical protein BCR43DRAFT_489312 [Syncephalastrum racemosum]|uniref:Uncharacterized protein n=1 Tax=Syncephalastrum racemosum TaxID=13706 RepID=A0A1X2HK79_SYNRA|nr:hypothetical protein BCR43DRAFT_489312 [Syncephalastrum racemosum]